MYLSKDSKWNGRVKDMCKDVIFKVVVSFLRKKMLVVLWIFAVDVVELGMCDTNV